MNRFKMSKEEKAVAAKIVPGRIFDTGYEIGCIAINSPDEDGEFAGLDSSGVECAFNVRMVGFLGEINVRLLEDK